eukprot:6207223-Pleurochrysis_carterae.AAC.2
MVSRLHVTASTNLPWLRRHNSMMSGGMIEHTTLMPLSLRTTPFVHPNTARPDATERVSKRRYRALLPADGARLVHRVLLIVPMLEGGVRWAQLQEQQTHLVGQVHLEETLLGAAASIRTTGWLPAERHELVIPTRLQHLYVSPVTSCLLHPPPPNEFALPGQQILPQLVDIVQAHRATRGPGHHWCSGVFPGCHWTSSCSPVRAYDTHDQNTPLGFSLRKLRTLHSPPLNPVMGGLNKKAAFKHHSIRHIVYMQTVNS